MTVPNENNRNGPYLADGVNKTFGRSFMALDGDHVMVFSTVDGVTTEVTTGFTQTGIGTTSGDVVFTTAPASGTEITLVLSVPNTQSTDYSDEGRVSPEQVERDLDLAALRSLSLSERLDRALTAPVTGKDFTSGNTPIFDAEGNLVDGPSASDISSAQEYATAAGLQAAAAAESAEEAATFDPALYLAKADNLSGLASTGTAQSNLGISTYIKTLISAANAAAARAILGVGTNGTLSQTALQLAQAVWNAGTSATEAYISPAKLAAAIAAQVTGVEKFTSSAFTATAAGLVTVSHGMSGPPRFIAYRGKCLVADAGYAVDDEILLSINQSNSSQAKDNTPVITDTQIIVKLTNNSTAFSASNKTTGVTNGLTNTSWDYYIEAIR